MGSDRKRHKSAKRNKHKMEHRYNSNKVLDYKRTPSKSKKRTLAGSNNHSFLGSSKHGSRYNIKDHSSLYSKDLYSDRRKSVKKYDKRSMSNGTRKTKNLYLDEDSRSPMKHGSNKKDKSYSRHYEDSYKKSSKSKKHHYGLTGNNYYFKNLSSSSGIKAIKQHNIVKKHVDHKIPSTSFQCHQIIPDMISPNRAEEIMNNSATTSHKPCLTSHQSQKSRRLNAFNAPSKKSRDQNQSELTPLNSN